MQLSWMVLLRVPRKALAAVVARYVSLDVVDTFRLSGRRKQQPMRKVGARKRTRGMTATQSHVARGAD